MFDQIEIFLKHRRTSYPSRKFYGGSGNQILKADLQI